MAKKVFASALVAMAALLVGLAGAAPDALARQKKSDRVTLPAPRCTHVGATLVAGQMEATAVCTVGKKTVVGRWTWKATITDASGVVCHVAAESGHGSTFRVVPEHPWYVDATFTLIVPKTRTHGSKKLVVSPGEFVKGYDVCGAPLEVVSGGDSQVCVYTDYPDYTAGSQISMGGFVKVLCPPSFGHCTWVTRTTKSSPGPGVTVYGGYVNCSGGQEAIPYLSLFSAGGACRLDLAYATNFVIPPTWSGSVYWSVALGTIIAPGDQPEWAKPFWATPVFPLNGSKTPFCGAGR